MSELILTDEEKQTKMWADLDDASLGKVVKNLMFGIKTYSEEQKKLFWLSAAFILCTGAAEANADKVTQTIEGLTSKGQNMGNWKITVRRVKASTHEGDR